MMKTGEVLIVRRTWVNVTTHYVIPVPDQVNVWNVLIMLV